MQRFFLSTSHLWEKQIILQDNQIIYQLVKVLRAKIDEEVIFFNGEQNIDFVYKITSIDKKNIIFSFVELMKKADEKYILVLFQSLPNKIDKIEEIIQKWTEIGYSEFHFFRAERSQDLKISESKRERWNKIIKEASEQSGRNSIPKLNFLTKLDITRISGMNIFFHTDSNNAIKINELKLDLTQRINIFVWPEWGFSPKENDTFEKNKCIKINLGNNILRTQTTSIWVWFYILHK